MGLEECGLLEGHVRNTGLEVGVWYWKDHTLKDHTLMARLRIKQRTKRKTVVGVSVNIRRTEERKRNVNQVYEDLARLRKAIVLADCFDAWVPPVKSSLLSILRDDQWEKFSRAIGVNIPSEETKQVVLDLLKKREAARERFQKRRSTSRKK